MTTFPAAERKLGEARSRLTYARPYFSEGAYALRLIVTLDVPRLAIDAWGRVYANPGWVEQRDVGTVATGLSHELQHLLRDHAGRAQTVGVSYDTMTLWNEAGDADINFGLMVDCRTCKPPLPELLDCILPKHLGLPDGKVAEWYYAERLKLRREARRAGGGEVQEDGGSGDGGKGRRGQGTGTGTGGLPDFGCGSGSTGVPAPWEVGSPEASGIDGLDAADVWNVRRRVAEAAREHAKAKGRGSVPAGILDWANELLRPKRISWEQLLASAVRRASLTTAGAVRHSFHRPSRRQQAYGKVIMPSYRRPVPNVVLVLDTSISMSDEQRALGRGVVESACRHLAVPLRCIDVDAAVHRDLIVSSGRMTAQAGRGGTDMRVGIERALRRPVPADVIVVFTDCVTPWPTRRPAAHVIVAAAGASDEAIAGIPKWATVVRVEEA